MQRQRHKHKTEAIGKSKTPGAHTDHRVRNLRHRAKEVACQTDQVDFGEVQFGFSDKSDSDQEMNVEDMRVDAGTDAPKFIIL